MKRFVPFYFTLLLCMQPSQAQLSRNQAVEVLNLYVRYGNETIHALWPMYEELMGFNADLNRLQPNASSYLTFRNEDYLNNLSNYPIIPAILYQQCLTRSKILALPDQKVLNGQLNELNETLDQLQMHRDSLDIFVKEKWFAVPKNIPWAYNQLRQVETTFSRYKKQKDDLYREIEKIYTRTYKPANTTHKIVTMAEKFQPALKWCKAMLDDLNENDTAKIGFYTQALETLIGQYEKQRDENLKGLYRFGRYNGLDPESRYNNVITELEAIVAHGRHFSHSDWRDGNYRHYSKAYEYYNTKVLNKYNRYGMGLIHYYNDFVDLADGKQIQKTAEIPDYYIKNKSIPLDVSVTKLLYAIEEPHQYRVSYPSEKPIAKPPTGGFVVAKDTISETLEGYADNHLIFLLDVSGSMNSADKLPLLKEAFNYLLSLTRPTDKIALVSYSGEARIELPTVSAAEQKKIKAKLNKLKSEGGTNVTRGLTLAYQLANQHFIPKGNNRIILASDGEFGIEAATEKLIDENRQKGILLTVFLFGQTKNEHVVQQLKHLATTGKGNFQQIHAENAKQALLKEAQAIRR